MQSSNENRYDYEGLSPEKPASSEGWNMPKPEVLASPTYWPFVLSVGTALIGLGVLTSMLISIMGTALFIFAIVKWVGELLGDQR